MMTGGSAEPGGERNDQLQPAVKRHCAEQRGAPGSAILTLDWTHLDSAAMLLLLLQGGPSAACLALFFYSHFLEPTLVLAFNLDTSHVIRKDGEPGSLFGFSLAMHRQLNPDKRM